jgi:ectoine hydroxylase-related dioxygenase (phytanoyl-CoA dioxygenase family)
MTPTPSSTADLEHVTAQLLDEGFCVLRDVVPAAQVRALDQALAADFAAAPFCEGKFYGERTRRFGRVLARSQLAAPLVTHPLVLAVVQRVLGAWADTIQLNLTQAIAIDPGELAQMPHRDEDMWGGPKGEIEYLVNVMWALTPFTRENGGTRLWPGSHRPADEPRFAEDEAIVPAFGPGSALLFLGSTLHAAGPNASAGVRRGLITGYSLGWLKTYENQFLAYPPEVAREFDRGLAALVGYRLHRPNLGNFEGRCPSVLLDSGDHGPLAATDALRPEQKDAVDAYAGQQARPSVRAAGCNWS